MDITLLVLLFLAIGVIAFLYSSVGHAGASGYIATMTLFGIAPTIIRPTALVVNISVASIIRVNSMVGLIGYFTKVRSIPTLGFILAAAAIIGGSVGSHLSSRRFAV